QGGDAPSQGGAPVQDGAQTDGLANAPQDARPDAQNDTQQDSQQVPVQPPTQTSLAPHPA
ncbi:MAG: hypothetical protein ABUL50_11290, partial [Rhizobacter sp.]